MNCMKITTLALIATATVAAALALPASAQADASAPHGVEAAIGAVPWSQVGPGWLLAIWSPVSGKNFGETPPPGEPTYETATTTLYLVDPEGGRYAITTFPPPGDGPSPKLVDWSGDGSRALFETDGTSTVTLTEVDLHTGTKNSFTVNGNGYVTARYTRPEGKAVLLETRHDYGPGSLERVDLAGNHQLTYPVGQGFGGYLSAPDGTQLVVSTGSGLAMMGNDGSTGKALPVAGQTDCSPTRWWDSGSTIAVARCGSSQSQLWLVPIDGRTPTALTAPTNGKGPDYGDRNAWQLPAGTYVQATGACGVIYLARLNADGTTSQVSVPGLQSRSVVVIGANGGHLDLQARAGCGPGQSLLDYDPAAGTSTVLLGPSINGGGVVDAVPYPGKE
jgi:Tol biopolymer transport system component